VTAKEAPTSSPESDLFYRERPRCPLWIYGAFSLVPVVATGAVAAVLLLAGAHGQYWAIGIIALVGAALCGPQPAVSQRLVIVDRLGLHVGRMLIPVDSVTATRPLYGTALKAVRHEIAHVSDVSTGLRLGPLSSGLAMVAAGMSLIETKDRRRGMLCSPWQEPALLVETPALPTKRWLISARDPRRLEEAIGRARSAEFDLNREQRV